MSEINSPKYKTEKITRRLVTVAFKNGTDKTLAIDPEDTLDIQPEDKGSQSAHIYAKKALLNEEITIYLDGANYYAIATIQAERNLRVEGKRVPIEPTE